MSKIKDTFESALQGMMDALNPPSDAELKSRAYISEAKFRQAMERENRIRRSLAALNMPQPTELTKEEWAKVLADTDEE